MILQYFTIELHMCPKRWGSPTVGHTPPYLPTNTQWISFTAPVTCITLHQHPALHCTSHLHPTAPGPCITMHQPSVSTLHKLPTMYIVIEPNSCRPACQIILWSSDDKIALDQCLAYIFCKIYVYVYYLQISFAMYSLLNVLKPVPTINLYSNNKFVFY